MAKLKGWQITLITMLVVPVLRKLCDQLAEKAEETPESWDDIAVAAFGTVIEFLSGDHLQELLGD